MTNFQRARSEEQREIRRRTILDTAAAMLEEMPVGVITLNELSRRVGLAKSNVLRYFESREAILLELLDRAWKRWNTELENLLAAHMESGAPVLRRAETFATVTAGSLAQTDHQALCDLLSAQAGVLEHNVSPEVGVRYKKEAIGNVEDLAALLQAYVPELDDAEAYWVCGQVIMVVGAIWTRARPSSAMLAAYAEDSALASQCMDFDRDLQPVVATLLAGTLARRADYASGS